MKFRSRVSCFVRANAKAIVALAMWVAGTAVAHGADLPLGWQLILPGLVSSAIVWLVPNTGCDQA
jgi:hypothetical protein